LLGLLFNPEDAGSMLADFHQTTRCYIPEDITLEKMFICRLIVESTANQQSKRYLCFNQHGILPKTKFVVYSVYIE
jgi:hypothetical protein